MALACAPLNDRPMPTPGPFGTSPATAIVMDKTHHEESASGLHIVAARLPLDGIRVLSVDDDEAAREAIHDVLEAEGAEVSTAGSWSEALSQIDLESPDVMIVDIGMPVVDGFTLVEYLRRRPAGRGGDVPCIALTGYMSLEDREHALRSGFQAFLTKPVDWDVLVETVKALLPHD